MNPSSFTLLHNDAWQTCLGHFGVWKSNKNVNIFWKCAHTMMCVSQTLSSVSNNITENPGDTQDLNIGTS